MWLFNFKFSLVLSLFSRSLIAFVILVVLFKCMLIKFLWTGSRLTEVIRIFSKCSKCHCYMSLNVIAICCFQKKFQKSFTCVIYDKKSKIA